MRIEGFLHGDTMWRYKNRIISIQFNDVTHLHNIMLIFRCFLRQIYFIYVPIAFIFIYFCLALFWAVLGVCVCVCVHVPISFSASFF